MSPLRLREQIAIGLAEGDAFRREEVRRLLAAPAGERQKEVLAPEFLFLSPEQRRDVIESLKDAALAEVSESTQATADAVARIAQQMEDLAGKVGAAPSSALRSQIVQVEVPVPAVGAPPHAARAVLAAVAAGLIGIAVGLTAAPHLQRHGLLWQAGVSAEERADLRWASGFQGSESRALASWAVTDTGRWAKRFADRNGFLREQCPNASHDVETGEVTCMPRIWAVR